MTELTALKEVLREQLEIYGNNWPLTHRDLFGLIDRAGEFSEQGETKSAEKLFTQQDMIEFARYCARTDGFTYYDEEEVLKQWRLSI